MSGPPWCASEDPRRKWANYLTAALGFVLVVLTYHTHMVTLAGAAAGSGRGQLSEARQRRRRRWDRAWNRRGAACSRI